MAGDGLNLFSRRMCSPSESLSMTAYNLRGGSLGTCKRCASARDRDDRSSCGPVAARNERHVRAFRPERGRPERAGGERRLLRARHMAPPSLVSVVVRRGSAQPVEDAVAASRRKPAELEAGRLIRAQIVGSQGYDLMVTPVGE